jgi:hypothetical protein
LAYTEEQIEKALREARGLVYLAAKKLGCNPKTIFCRLAKNPKLAALRQNVRMELLDTAEEKLLDAVEAGESWAITFLLKTQGQDRGYSPTGRGYLLSQIARAEADLIESINELTGPKSWTDAIVMLKALSAAETNLRASLTALCLTPRAIAAARLKNQEKMAPEPKESKLSDGDKKLFETRR